MMKRVAYMLFPIFCVLLLLGCGRGKGSDEKPGGGKYMDSLMKACDERGGEVTDSLLLATNRLEMMGYLSSEEADFCRAVLYFDHGSLRLQEFYYRRSLRDDLLYHRNPYYYFNSIKNLATILKCRNDYYEIMKLLFQALDRLQYQEQWMQRHFRGYFMMMIGECQLKTGLTKEGLATVDRARKFFRSCYEADTTYLPSLMAWNIAVINFVSPRPEVEELDYESFLDEAEETTRLLEKRPDSPQFSVKESWSIILFLRANLYAEKGLKAEAAKAYEEYQKFCSSLSLESALDRFSFYKNLQQWQEAADQIPEIIMDQNGNETEPSLDNLSILADCYQVARKAGREQESQALADTIAALVDSTKLYHQKKDVVELGIIYDTEQKNEEITRQKWENRRQLWTAVGVVLMLIIVFLAFYGRFRRLSAARLRVANDKLHEVNDKLHETNDELQRRHVELQVVHEKAEEASRMKAMFIQQISHEIRTPLNILSGYTQIITMPDVQLEAKERRDIVRKITDNTDRITQLINKMLDLSEAGSQTVIERTDNVTVAEIAVQAIAVVGIREDPRLDFSLSYTTEQLTPLTTNLRYAIKALVMLLDNAMKFTRPAGDSDNETDELPEKKEEVRLIVGASDGFATFTVEDTGCGVPSGEAEHIFEEFVQLNEFYEGTGIGLSVARSIARRLGGDITLDTDYFHGARFVMTLALKNENDINE